MRRRPSAFCFPCEKTVGSARFGTRTRGIYDCTGGFRVACQYPATGEAEALESRAEMSDPDTSRGPCSPRSADPCLNANRIEQARIEHLGVQAMQRIDLQGARPCRMLQAVALRVVQVGEREQKGRAPVESASPGRPDWSCAKCAPVARTGPGSPNAHRPGSVPWHLPSRPPGPSPGRD
jgi:hypothetical protein